MPDDGSSLTGRDRWSKWLIQGRHGGDPGRLQALLGELAMVRESVLEHASLGPGAEVLDVGAGEGLIGFGALERVGPRGRVIFSDISRDLVDLCRTRAERLEVAKRCRFVVAGAADLAPIRDGSVDAVTTRSVLIYVAEKPRAFAEFFRVLRPGGRISLHEPINRLMCTEPAAELLGYDVGPVQDLAAKVRAVAQEQSEGESTLLDFDERDLVALAETASFCEIHLELRRQIARELAPMTWEAFLASSDNPLAWSHGEMIERALTGAERVRFQTHLRPLVEAGVKVRRLALAELWAQKPS